MPQASSFVADHRALRALIEALREHATVTTGRESAWRAAVTAHLGELRAQLEAHFAEEEESGLFEQMAETGTENLPAAEHLRADHAALRGRLSALCADAEGGGARVRATDLSKRLQVLLDDLEAHEERENEVLLRSLEGSFAVD